MLEESVSGNYDLTGIVSTVSTTGTVSVTGDAFFDVKGTVSLLRAVGIGTYKANTWHHVATFGHSTLNTSIYYVWAAGSWASNLDVYYRVRRTSDSKDVIYGVSSCYGRSNQYYSFGYPDQHGPGNLNFYIFVS
ncbi:MAG: hypothetical protein QHH15_07950, partial [Candidatus Thermoplasmatota archaeon]|nr:hypothetical protein [Candidatus Thermoplasmatota archaeon]